MNFLLLEMFLQKLDMCVMETSRENWTYIFQFGLDYP